MPVCSAEPLKSSYIVICFIPNEINDIRLSITLPAKTMTNKHIRSVLLQCNVSTLSVEWQRKWVRVTLCIYYFSKLLDHLQIRWKMQISIYILFQIIIIAITTASHYIYIAQYLL